MNQSLIQISDTTANPAPLGLLGFGMTTVLLNIHNAGFFELNSMILGMGIFYGGAAQIIAGLMEWKKRNTFATTAFVSYGFFWQVLVALILLPKIIPSATPTNPVAFATFLAMWGIFTAVMFVGTLRLSRALQFVFGSLTILFFLLVAAKLTGSETIEHVAGYEGIVCGASAMYTGLAQVINELYGSAVLPLGAPKQA